MPEIVPSKTPRPAGIQRACFVCVLFRGILHFMFQFTETFCGLGNDQSVRVCICDSKVFLNYFPQIELVTSICQSVLDPSFIHEVN